MSESLEAPALPVDEIDTDILDRMTEELRKAGGCFNLCLNVFDFEAVIYSLHSVTTKEINKTAKINMELLTGIAKTMGLEYPDA